MFVQLESGEIVFRVAEATTYNQRAEVACWSTTILVQPGDYPVSYARLDNQKPTGLEDAYYVCVGLPGVITEDFTLQNAGKPATYHIQVYGYMVKEVIQKQLAASDLSAMQLAEDPGDEVLAAHINDLDADQLSDAAQDSYEASYAQAEESQIQADEASSILVSRFSRSAH